MSKLKIIRNIFIVIYAVIKTVRELDWIVLTAHSVKTSILTWLYPFICVDSTLFISVHFVVGVVFICVLIWNLFKDLIMTV